jgi:hypothetical protein
MRLEPRSWCLFALAARSVGLGWCAAVFTVISGVLAGSCAFVLVSFGAEPKLSSSEIQPRPPHVETRGNACKHVLPDACPLPTLPHCIANAGA